MDELIQEIMGAIVSAAKAHKRDWEMEDFIHWLSCERSSDAKRKLVAHLTPILAKHIKPDQVKEIKRLLREANAKAFPGTSHFIKLHGDGSGGVETREGRVITFDGNEPEDILRTLIAKYRTPITPPLTPSTVTITMDDGRIVTGTFTPDE